MSWPASLWLLPQAGSCSPHADLLLAFAPSDDRRPLSWQDSSLLLCHEAPPVLLTPRCSPALAALAPAMSNSPLRGLASASVLATPLVLTISADAPRPLLVCPPSSFTMLLLLLLPLHLLSRMSLWPLKAMVPALLLLLQEPPAAMQPAKLGRVRMSA